jgi:hypothetical protein
MFEQGWKRISLAAVCAVLLGGAAGAVATDAAISVPSTTTVLPTTTTVTTPPPSSVTDGVTHIVTTTPLPPTKAPAPTVTTPKVTTPTVKVPSAKVTAPTGGGGSVTVQTPSATVGGSTGGGGGGTTRTGVSVGGTSVSAGGGGTVTTGGGDTVRQLTGSPSAGTGISPLLGGGGGGGPAGGAGATGTATGPGGTAGGPGAGPGTLRSLRMIPASGIVTTSALVALVEQLQGCLTELPPLQRDFLIFRAGLDGGGSRTLSELSRALGVSPARARLIQRRAVQGLRGAAQRGSCAGGTAIAYAAGLFASPALLGDPLGSLFGPDAGRGDRRTVGSTATAYPTAQRTFGQTLRDLGGDSSPGELWLVLAVILLLAASVAGLMREARRSF